MNLAIIWNLIIKKTMAVRIFLKTVIQQRGYDIAEGAFLLAVWYHFVSLFIGSNKIQTGNEFGVHISSFQNWSNGLTCGLCMMWGNMMHYYHRATTRADSQAIAVAPAGCAVG